MTGIAIEEIVGVVQKIVQRIQSYKGELSKNEALVRYSLIDPFLRSLGWDTEDPGQVIPEFSIEAGRPDYALFAQNKSKPIAFIGAKKLGSNEDLEKQVTYCVNKGVKYFIVTDGNKWEVYDAFKEEELHKKKIAEWKMEEDDAYTIAFKALLIANTPKFGNTPNHPVLDTKDLEGEKRVEVNTSPQKFGLKQVERLILTILENSEKPLTRKEIVERSRALLILDDNANKPTKSGMPRWETRVRWEVTKLKGKNLIESRGHNAWVITDLGRNHLKNIEQLSS
ncbi:hypothetical protein B9Q13_01585 [Candidatus Marsarchaeota G2 archaeon ECH_B_SAG-G16]|uniref:Restriction system protein Mrr-like N-terminal domain-containing protein n=1 Tax=Candidatus Marsarchaeota G2 archaeon ECH_B_SAG-G16 TaxID=1978167 RepID=A0A2R6C3T6_9ARCH|nr:MAG: hypothetical protein B9Q13_01585 [Candidatus Marsarchaeota G2 archaeon ECH_B_SAG-G16]